MNCRWRSFLVCASIATLVACSGPKRRAKRPVAEDPAFATGPTTESSDDPWAKSTLPEPSQQSSPSSPPTKASTADPVELLSPGEEPRKVLRRKFVVGQKERFVVEESGNEQAMAGDIRKTPPLRGQHTRATFSVETRSVDARGNATLAVRIERFEFVVEPGRSPPSATSMQEAQAMLGSSGTVVMSSRGLTRDATVGVSANATDAAKRAHETLLESLRSMGDPLPDAAVGKGAKWRMSTTKRLTGVDVTCLDTYELVSASDEGDLVRFQSRVDGAPQNVNWFEMPPGVTLRLNSMEGQVGGESKYTAGHVIAETKQLLQMMSRATVHAHGQEGSVGIWVRRYITITPLP